MSKIKLETLPYGSNKKIENLLIFRMVWENMVAAEWGEIRHLAIRRWLQTRSNPMEALCYAIECITNKIIAEEENKRTDEC